VANLRVNPSVEVNVVDPFVRKGYRFRGQASVIDEGAEFDRLVEFFSNRGTPDAPRRIHVVVVIHVDRARALVSPAYDREKSESSMREHWKQYYLGDTATPD
jgi:hypothetical protein